MRTLYLLRHAKSSWGDDTLADHERPLSSRGIRDGKRIAKHLRTLHAHPDLVLCSSAVRARQTFDLIESSLGDAPVSFDEGLYAASADALLERLRGIPQSAQSALVIGHNPGLQDLAIRLATHGPGLDEVITKFPTGALATLALTNQTWASVHPGDAVLIGYTIPRSLS